VCTVSAPFIWVITLVAASAVRADDVPQDAFTVVKITEDQWRARLTEVQGTSGVECETVGALYHCHTTHGIHWWTFTVEGHPAHPAVSEAVGVVHLFCGPLHYSGPQLTMTRTGEYAGDRAAFEKMMRRLKDSDQRAMSRGKQCEANRPTAPTAKDTP
jgi:hypothetical protein